jgi:outer membrane immunogenic protein
MKKFLLAGVATVALIGAASAADLGRPVYKAPPPAPPPPPVFSWTGCFVGAHWGWGWGHNTLDERLHVTDLSDTDIPDETFAASGGTSDSGALFGGQVGCDYQFGWGKGKGVGGAGGGWVIGLQFDAAGTDINTSQADPLLFSVAPVAAGLFPDRVKEDWLASFTGRLGYAGGFMSPMSLVYIRGGVAWTHNRLDLPGVGDVLLGETDGFFPGPEGPLTKTRTGWTVGIGWEWAFLPNWSAFVEWNHYDFGTKTLFAGNATIPNFIEHEPFDSLGVSAAIDAKQRLETVKIGVNYRFNLFGKAPVVARY